VEPFISVCSPSHFYVRQASSLHMFLYGSYLLHYIWSDKFLPFMIRIFPFSQKLLKVVNKARLVQGFPGCVQTLGLLGL